MDPKPSLTLHTVPGKRLSFDSQFLNHLPLARRVLAEQAPETLLHREVDAEWGEVPPMRRLGRIAGVTLVMCVTAIGLAYVALLLRAGI